MHGEFLKLCCFFGTHFCRNVFNGGVRTAIVIVYPLLIMYVGWRVSLTAAKAVTALNVVTIFGFVLAESWGFLPKAPPTPAVMPSRTNQATAWS